MQTRVVPQFQNKLSAFLCIVGLMVFFFAHALLLFVARLPKHGQLRASFLWAAGGIAPEEAKAWP